MGGWTTCWSLCGDSLCSALLLYSLMAASTDELRLAHLPQLVAWKVRGQDIHGAFDLVLHFPLCSSRLSGSLMPPLSTHHRKE